MTTISDPAIPAADDLRNALVDTIVSNGLLRTPRIEQVMRAVPRHVFVPAASLGAAVAGHGPGSEDLARPHPAASASAHR